MRHWCHQTGRLTPSLSRLRLASMFALALLFAAPSLSDAADILVAPHAAIEPTAPSIPPELAAAIQELHFDDARRMLVTLQRGTTDPDRIQYQTYLSAIVERLAGQLQPARALLIAAVEQNPTGRWSTKLRHELAVVELALGNLPAAEVLVRGEATRLLSADRKDHLATVYESIANRLLSPTDPLTPADPQTAYTLLEQAQGVARSATLRARYLAAMVDVSLTANQPTRAVEHARNYLSQFPKGAQILSVRFALGRAEQQSGQPAAARATWTDLAAEIERSNPADLSSEPSRLRASALYEIASTYGIPNPPDDNSLNLGVAALRRYLATYPAGLNAVRAAFSIAQAYQSRAKTADELESYRAFLAQQGFQTPTDESRRLWSELAMPATFQVGEILRDQQKWTDAIDALKAYLTRCPDGPQTVEAQMHILDCRIAIAADHQTHKRFDQARAAYSEFVAANPLEARVPEVLFTIGETFSLEKRYTEAIAAWDSLAARFPSTIPAAHAQFAAAALIETEKGQPAEAIERYRKITLDPWRQSAGQHVLVMEQKSLAVVTPRTYRSGEKARLQVSTRNLETLHFSAYKLNAEAYFRKKAGLANVENLDIGLVAPDASWSAPVAGYSRYKPTESLIDLDKLELPGAYVVKVSDDKTLQASTLVIGSDVDAIIRSSRDQLLLFAQDMKTGKGRPGARVIISQGGEILVEAATGPDGVLLRDWPSPRNPSSQLGFLVLDGPHVAGSFLGIPSQVSQGLAPRAYLYTDRPAYRPGNNVSIRGVIREIENGLFAATPKAVYKLEVTDSRGRSFLAQPVTLSDFGTFALELPLDASAPIGTYNIRVYQPGKNEFTGAFEVQSYELEPINLSIDLKRTVFYRGENVQADLFARFNYGTPLAARPIEVTLPDGRILNAQTDAAGKFHIEFPTVGFGESQPLPITARLPLDNVSTTARAILAVRGFEIALNTARDTYLVAESFPLDITTTDALGTPISQKLTATVIEKIDAPTGSTERELEQKVVETDAKTGLASVPFQIDRAAGGHYLIRVAGTDRFQNPIVADRLLFISGSSDNTKLRLLADHLKYKLGEEAQIRLHSRDRSGTALITWEANRILSYKLINLVSGENPLSWKVDSAQFPNFTLTASHMSQTYFDEAKLDLQVTRELQVTLTPVKPVVQPGEDIEIDVTTTDQLGQPVSAELSLAMVDQSLFRLFDDRLPAINAFFYNQTRTGAFATQATSTFRYNARTSPISTAVVEEAERDAAIAANDTDRAKILDMAAADLPAGEAFSPLVATAPRATATGALLAPILGKSPLAAGQAQSKMMRRESVTEQLVQSDRKSKGSGGVGGGMVAGKPMADEPAVAGEINTFGRFANPANAAPAPPPRQRFIETAYWNPAVVTDKEGKTRIRFKAPTALAEFRLTARGITAADTLAGQTTAPITVRKNFSVDLKVPSALTQGDKPRFLATIQHQGVNGKVLLRLSTYGTGRDEVYPATIDIKNDGVDEVHFEPIDIPEADSLRLTLTATIGDLSDSISTEVPVHPWGVPAYASASGTSSQSSTVFLGLPPGRAYENADMLISITPTVRRMIIELALAQTPEPLDIHFASRVLPPPPSTLIDQASDLLAATAALGYLRDLRGAPAPEAARLVSRVRGLTAALIAAQNDDGGWSWTPPVISPLCVVQNAPPRPGSDALTSAAVFQALTSAEPFGLITDTKLLDRASSHLTQIYSTQPQADFETRSAVLHALSTRHAASFEAANTLNRLRNRLPDSALANLALTFANLDRPTIASEILTILAPRARTEPSGPGLPARLYWDNGSSTLRASIDRGSVSTVDTTARVALAFARIQPAASQLQPAIEWLLAHRAGNGWHPHTATGPALSALASFYGHAQVVENRYRLAVSVNNASVAQLEVIGSSQSQSIIVPRAALQVAKSNRIRFDMTGRGQFSYAATLCAFTRDFAPDQTRANRIAHVNRRVYLPAAPQLEGRVLPIGFSVAPGSTEFENRATQLLLGGKARVQLTVNRAQNSNTPVWQRDFLIVEEHLPAGTSLVEGSLRTSAISSSLNEGTLTLYFPPSINPGTIHYDVYGFLPGQYHALPASVRSAYEPGRYHLGQPNEFRVRTPEEPATDPYRPTPDELFARGTADFDAGRLSAAATALEPLFAEYSLRDDVTRDAARMLLLINLAEPNSRKIVQYFEVVRDKAPDVVLSFDQLLAIGQAYRDLGEHERALIVWRGLIEAGYIEDAKIAEFLRQRGQNLQATAFLLQLWRTYPSTATIDSDFFSLSQLLVQSASTAITTPQTRRELAAAGVTRSQLLLQAIRIIDTFLAQSPTSPLADQAGLALLGAHTELENYKAIAPLAGRFAKIYSKSPFLDSFQYSAALADFHLGQFDHAVEIAQKIANASYKDAFGADQPSPNKWQALYILGQIHDARRQPALALDFYRQVADRFTDASSAIQAYTRKQLEIPEVTIVRPSQVQNATPAAPGPAVTLNALNIKSVDLEVYPIDLMRLYLARRSLNSIAGIDLAGITPLVKKTVSLADQPAYQRNVKSIELPLTKQGAYLVMIRAENTHASGIVLVTPLELDVFEELANDSQNAVSSRIRVTVRDALTKALLPDVQVKLIGSGDSQFITGQSDLRGVFIAEGLSGVPTAVVRKGLDQYAFYRGKPDPRSAPSPRQRGSSNEVNRGRAPQDQSLDGNLKDLNTNNALQQLNRLRQRLDTLPPKQQGAPAGSFR